MHDTISNWRFDESLFKKYPELKFAGYESLVGRGMSFRRPSRRLGPSRLSGWITNLYRKALLGASASPWKF